MLWRGAPTKGFGGVAWYAWRPLATALASAPATVLANLRAGVMAHPRTRALANPRANVRAIALVCAALGFGLASAPGSAATLSAGPMAGHRDARSTIIWLQADAKARAQLEYWPEAAPKQRKRSPPVWLAADDDYAAQIALQQLAPGTRYRYRVLLDGKEAPLAQPLSFATEALWQWRKHSFMPAQGHTPPDFTVAFGSCVYVNEPPFDRSLAPTGKPYGTNYGIFASIAARKPDVMLWLGDNTYLREADYASPSGMAYRFRHDRALPELQSLLRTGNHYAIWDDHDFGPDDSNASFTYKDQSLRLFQRYWANGAWGQPGVPGIFRAVSLNDVDFFLLDGRFNRDADGAQNLPGKALFGAPQLRWLRNALLASDARFKVIVAGNQSIKEVPPRIEGWSHFSDERREFLDWLGANRVNGVLFLSGDRHHTELNRQERHGAYPLYDFTCSPLTSGVHAPARNEDMSRADADTVVNQHNFCTLDFSGEWGERRLTMKSFDAAGRELWKREIGANDLTHPRP